MALANVAVGNTDTDIYTSSGETCVVTMYFCNYSASTVTLSIHAVENGGSVADGSLIAKDITITAADTYVLSSDRMVLANGDKISAIASAGSSVTATVSYASV